MSLRVLIVDDEPLARQRLQRLMEEHKNFEVVAEAGNGQAAVDWLRQHDADVVLMDIQMPGLTGLEAAEQIQQLDFSGRKSPAIIFCTAYDEHALQAFRVDAVDYLLKPINKDDLTKALGKAQRAWEQQPEAASASTERTHISARTHQGLQLIAIEDIICFQADQKYITVTYVDGEVLIDESLKHLEEEFSDYFVRIHRNALVSKTKIERLESVESSVHLLHLKGLDQGLSVSRRHLPGVRKLIRSL